MRHVGPTRRPGRTIKTFVEALAATMLLMAGAQRPHTGIGGELPTRPKGGPEQTGKVPFANENAGQPRGSRLLTEYKTFVRDLADQLRRAREADDLDHAFGSPLHWNLELSGQLRAGECTGELARMLTYKVDRKTIPTGDQYGPAYLYPAATALVAIGDGAVVRATIQRLRTAQDDETLSVGTWVLWKINGEAFAKAVLREAIEDVRTEGERANLKKSMDLAPRGESLMTF